MTITVGHYIGLVAPRCTLTYSVPPCQAQLGFIGGGAPWLVDLNSEYARRTAGLTSAADSKLLTGSLWFQSVVGADQTIFAGTTTAGGTTLRVDVMQTVSGRFRVRARNSGGTVILDVVTAPLNTFQLYHIIFSFDLSSTSKRWMYVDGVSDLGVTTYTNDTIDFTLGDWSFGALPNGTVPVDLDFSFGDFWFAPGVYIDFSVAANRELFRSATGRPVYLGGNGEVPTGTSPRVFFTRGPTDWEVNDGTGGGFTISNDGNAFNRTFHTGDQKCFNSLGTCQDLENFDDTDSPILIFGEDVSIEGRKSVFSGVPIFPFVKSIDFQSAIISLGDNMGQRGSLSVIMRDAPHNDLPPAYFDKYLADRVAEDSDYDPYRKGTFWGKFRARNPYMRFQALYLFTVQRDGNGDIDGTLETRTYLIESISGPDNNGDVKITGKDTLKVADGEYAQAPVQSPGFLSADITNSDTSATMSPSGAIDSYPSSGHVCIGGNEIVAFSKTGGDNFSMTRAQLGTVASAHSAQDRIQLVYYQSSQSPDLIIADLLTSYAGIDAGLIDSDAWAAEIAQNLNTVYTFVIVEPTAVNKLISEIIQQIGGAIWWDDVAQQIRLQILKSVSDTAYRWNVDAILRGSLQVTEQEDKRVTEVSVYFAQLNPTLKLDETHNYASVATVNDPTVEALVGGKSIKTVFARGIASGGRTVAERLAQKYLSRYVQPPRKVNFDLLKYSVQHPLLGGGYGVGGGGIDQFRKGYNNSALDTFQDEFGNSGTIPVQVTRVNPVGMKLQVEAEEMLFTAFGDDVDPTNHTVIFDVSRLDVNLEEVHDSIYAVAVSGDTVNCYINSGVIIGSSSTSSPAFTVGSFAGGVTVNIFINGRIQGHGGNGAGVAKGGSTTGQPGGTALYTRQTITVENNSEIWGGGGGGGMSNGTVGSGTFSNSGGGGAGSIPGIAGVPNPYTTYQNAAASGTTEAGGAAPFSPTGGNGGGPGLAGQNASGGSVFNSNGGAAGAAVDGTSFVTYSATGDRRGGLIN